MTGETVPPDRVPEPAPHPCDEGVILGSLGTDPAVAGTDAVVSLCQVGWADFPAIAPRDHLQIWLADLALKQTGTACTGRRQGVVEVMVAAGGTEGALPARRL